jgi:hypothetical protein
MPKLNHFPTNAKELYEWGASELTQRKLDFVKWWEYYEGKHKKFLKVREGEPDYNMIVNLCARVVDQSVNFMVGEIPTFDLPGEDEETATQEALLEAWMNLNDGEEFLTDLMTMQSVTGHAFVKLLPEPELHNVRPILLDTELVTAYWDPQDRSKTVGYMILWSESQGKEVVLHREDHLYVKDRNNWLIVSYKGSGNDWLQENEMIWSYPFAQIVDWKNLPNPRGYYGKSDIEQVISLNDAYNFRESNTNKILYIHAHPRTIGFGVEKSQIQQTSIDGFWTFPNESGRVENLEMQSDLESSRKHAAEVKADFFSDSQTVDISNVRDKVGQLTNFGLRLMFAEALSKNSKKRMLAGRGLAEMIRRAGVLMGLQWDGVTVQWADPLPENRDEQVKQAKETLSMGVASKQTEAERLGYDWERENKRIEQEKGTSAASLGQLLLKSMRNEASVGGSGEEEEADDAAA